MSFVTQPNKPQGWVSDEIDAYRLYERVVLEFLRTKFGNQPDGNYKVEFINDKFLFNVPRKLSDAEKDELMDKRDEKE
ncbi:hypothetical protein EV356DRAFT_502489 [Viridothelium virens]|uniref:Uncharacterized protein n=1 Tax=Viridothelium virens TaxID=1048519 RepID=A0A6A6H8H2_VIRVR|nr:hypothetical protein EV356DRAFT_502489 [Viridothelium virens]